MNSPDFRCNDLCFRSGKLKFDLSDAIDLSEMINLHLRLLAIGYTYHTYTPFLPVPCFRFIFIINAKHNNHI